MTKPIVIVDYGMGNLNSVRKKLHRIKVETLISSQPDEIRRAEKIILPGVGHFRRAVENIKSLGLWNPLNEAALVRKIPILGICLGLQLMTRRSDEGNSEGFGWFDAEVIRFDVKDKLKFKVPHMGWNVARVTRDSVLTEGLPELPEFYFVHSFHVGRCHPANILAETHYERGFISALEKDNLYGVQFHPEKSHDTGDILLRNFVRI